MNEERFIEIETKILHQDLTIEDMHNVLVKQQAQIEQLELTLNALVKRFREPAGGENEIGPHNQKPPNY